MGYGREDTKAQAKARAVEAVRGILGDTEPAHKVATLPPPKPSGVEILDAIDRELEGPHNGQAEPDLGPMTFEADEAPRVPPVELAGTPTADLVPVGCIETEAEHKAPPPPKVVARTEHDRVLGLLAEAERKETLIWAAVAQVAPEAEGRIRELVAFTRDFMGGQ